MLKLLFGSDAKFTVTPRYCGSALTETDMVNLSVKLSRVSRTQCFTPKWQWVGAGIEIEVQRENVPEPAAYAIILDWRSRDGSFSDGYRDMRDDTERVEFTRDCCARGGNVTVDVSPSYAGVPGKGVPAGGSPGQALVKKTSADYDTEWKTLNPGGGTGDGNDGKTPVIGAITAESIPSTDQPSFSLTHTSNDPGGNPVYTGTIKIPAGKNGGDGADGKTPILEIGTVETLAAGSQATASVVENGVDAQGNPKYKVNFGIPRGQNGTGDGGTVSLAWEDIEGKPSWIGATKPIYTASDVGALPTSHNTDVAAHGGVVAKVTLLEEKVLALGTGEGFSGSVTLTGEVTGNGSVGGDGNISIQTGVVPRKRIPFSQLQLLNGSYGSSTGAFSANSTYKSVLIPCNGGGQFGIYINGVLKGKNRTIFFKNGIVLLSSVISSELTETAIPSNATHVAINFSLDAGMTTVTAWDAGMLADAVFTGDVRDPAVEDYAFNRNIVAPLLSKGGFIFDSSSTFCMIGASFATPNNGWFESACQELGVAAVNKAAGNTVATDAATKLFNGTLWTNEEFEAIDVLAIMFTHNNEVAPPGSIKENLNSYTTGDLASSSPACWDYIIRKYRQLCYAAKDNTASKWYGTKHGKPCQIAICSHWHDGRPIFNKSVRRLCSIWDIPLVAFDENIGFTYRRPLEDGTQPSLIYAENPENVTIDGVAYSVGWHPTEGQDSYIQKRMAKIFIKYIGG